MRQTTRKKKTRKVSKFEWKEADMTRARRDDNFLALGAFASVWILGIHLHWYNSYTNGMAVLLASIFLIWRIPFLGLFAINPREREYWLGAIRSYLKFIPDSMMEPESEEEYLK